MGLGLGGGFVEFRLLTSNVVLIFDEAAIYLCVLSFSIGPVPGTPESGVESMGRKTEPAIRRVSRPASPLQEKESGPDTHFPFKVEECIGTRV
jgi:hypothetical protein